MSAPRHWSRFAKACLLALLASAGLPPAMAHTGGSLSYAQWSTADSGLLAHIRVKAADFRSLPAGSMDQGLAEYIRSQTLLTAKQQNCTATSSSVVPGTDPWVHLQLTFDCAFTPQGLELRWMEGLPGHLHLLTHAGSVTLLRGGRTQTLPWGEASTPTPLRALVNQWKHGVAHIAAGWDHLAFLLGLLLLARSLGALALMITGFTIGHTAALLLATEAGVLPPSVTVELVIAASIIFIGLPTAARHTRLLSPLLICVACGIAAWVVPGDPLLWGGLLLLSVMHHHLSARPAQAAMASLVLASAFGLLHGFGFASAVLEDAQQAAQLWPVLLGFNLGVESGQLLFVLPVWGLLQWWSQRGSTTPATTTGLIQAGVLAIGGFAFASRLLAAA